MKTIALDVDGVLLNFLQPMTMYLKKHGILVEDPVCFNIEDCTDDPEYTSYLIREFCSDPRKMGNLEPFTDYYFLTKEIENRELDVIICTSRMCDPKITLTNLQKYYGSIVGEHTPMFLSKHGSKAKVNADIFIEDDPRQISFILKDTNAVVISPCCTYNKEYLFKMKKSFKDRLFIKSDLGWNLVFNESWGMLL